MNLFMKISCLIYCVFFSSSAFAFINRIDALAFGGYNAVGQFSESTFDKSVGTMTGYDAGGMALLTLRSRIIAPVIGVGGEYFQVKSTIQDVSSGTQYGNTFTSQAATGHLGLRATLPLIRLFVLGNGGWGLTNSLNQNNSAIGSTNITSITNYKLNNHIFYGATASIVIFVFPFVKMGVAGIYNAHKASFVNQGTTVSKDLDFQEVSGNFVIDINL